jgi:hypothetical protein
MPVRPSILRSDRFRMFSGGIEGPQQGGLRLDSTDASGSRAVHAALVSFGRSAPACQVEGVLRPVGLVLPHQETGLKARHPWAQVLPGRVIAP